MSTENRLQYGSTEDRRGDIQQLGVELGELRFQAVSHRTPELSERLEQIQQQLAQQR
jgi:hypothetical protein